MRYKIPDLLKAYFPFNGKLTQASQRGNCIYVTDSHAPSTREWEFYYTGYPFNYNNDTLLVNFSGEELCKTGYYVKRYQSDMFMMKLILAGSMRFRTRGHDYLLKAGDVFFVQRNCDSEYTYGSEGYCRKIGATISGYLLDSLLFSGNLANVDVLHPDNPWAIETLIRSSMQILKMRGSDFLRRSAVTAFDILLTLADERERASYPAELTRAIAYSMQHPHRSVTAAEFAAAAGCRQAKLNDLFREKLNLTPVAYHTQQRLREAESMLMNTETSIKEIADSLGYSSAIYFSNDFKKHFSIGPRDFRRRTNNSPVIKPPMK